MDIESAGNCVFDVLHVSTSRCATEDFIKCAPSMIVCVRCILQVIYPLPRTVMYGAVCLSVAV